MMTFTSIVKATADRKKRPVALIVLLEIVLVLGLLLFKMISRRLGDTVGPGLLASSFSLSVLIGQIYMITRQEEIWTQNRYRLAPLSTFKLMLANYASTLLIDILFVASSLLIILVGLVLYSMESNLTFGPIKFGLPADFVPQFVIPGFAYLASWFGFTMFNLLFILFKRRINASGRKIGGVVIFFLIYATSSAIIAGLSWLSPWLTTPVLLVALPVLTVALFFFNHWLLENFVETGK